jgi:hypothetical protein
VLYRGGYFDSFWQESHYLTSPNGGVTTPLDTNRLKLDTTLLKNLKKQRLMSSSKSGSVFELPVFDSTKNNSVENEFLMESSKSGRIIRPIQLMDTTKKRIEKPSLMHSSKSGIIFRPQTDTLKKDSKKDKKPKK